MSSRQIVLDTETTGLDPTAGHRVIEIGGVEIRNRRLTGAQLHFYLQPDRAIDAEAQAVHGISNQFLADKPRFADIAAEFLDFVRGAELVIHNAAFDVGFLDQELAHCGRLSERLNTLCSIFDTLELARRLHPGQRNSLDALCRRYSIDNSQRELHGALLDATLLAQVYLAMTGGQVALSLAAERPAPVSVDRAAVASSKNPQPASRSRSRVIQANAAECQAHQQYLERLAASSGGPCLWQRLDSDD